jgi:acetate kinase
MKILVFNCGSSSVKFQVIDTAGNSRATQHDRKLAWGIVDRLGGQASITLKLSDGASTSEENLDISNFKDAVRTIIERLGALAQNVEAVGHRVVHGADLFTSATVIDDAVLAKIESLNELAPLHNPAALSGVHAARKILHSLPMAAVFDTAFHHTIPETAATYAIPVDLSKRHRIRRYGFHGIAHQYSVLRYGELHALSRDDIDIVTLHLGNGSSACAVRGGKSVDTSMGFTPLEGLVMGTRSGDLDPAIVGYLAGKENVSPAEVERWLNERSGLLGLSGLSHDMRELMAVYDTNLHARLAVDVFCYRARKYLAAYLGILGTAGAVVFSGGIGENTPTVRQKICEGMEWCGLELEQEKNRCTVGVEGAISAPGARLRAYVIPSDEEAIIARETATLFRRRAR